MEVWFSTTIQKEDGGDVVAVTNRTMATSDDGWKMLVEMLAGIDKKYVMLRAVEYSPRIKEIANLEKLDMSGGMLCNDEIPSEVFRIRLTTLRWKRANLVHVNGVQRMTWLTELDLIYNDITELPKEMWRMKSLRVLILSHNRIEVIPDSFVRFTALVRISLWDNKIADFPWQFLNCRGLQDIDLDGNPLHDQFPELRLVVPQKKTAYYLEFARVRKKRAQH